MGLFRKLFSYQLTPAMPRMDRQTIEARYLKHQDVRGRHPLDEATVIVDAAALSVDELADTVAAAVARQRARL